MIAIDLRDYQIESEEKLREGFRRGLKAQVLAASAGSGKTECAASFVSKCYAKFKRALFIVDRINLVDQTSTRFDKYEIPHGVIQAGHWRYRPRERVQIASAQTLEKRGFPQDFDLIVVDECHCMRKQITEYIKKSKGMVIGLSATPLTKGMADLYQGVVNVTTTNSLIDRGFLVPLKVYAAKRADMRGAKVVGGEYKESDIESRTLPIIGDVVAEWVSKTHLHFGGPVKTICFSPTVDTGTEFKNQFQAAGYRFEQISYKDGDPEQRKAIIDDFARPDTQIHGLIACEIFTKGWDCPDVKCGISARPYRKSLSSHIQQIGRVQRPWPGKEFGLWLCHSGNYLRFQDETDEIFENGIHELDDGRREEKAAKKSTEEQEAKSNKCSRCGFVMPPGVCKCPSCGFERQRGANIEVVAGEMVEVTGKLRGELAKMPAADLFAQLSYWALEKRQGDRHAAEKLALAKYKTWTGRFPKGHFGDDFEPPSQAVLGRIQHDNIAWAAKQRKSK